MNSLVESKIHFIYHITPIHYLPFIARSGALKSKTTLRDQNFLETHFRSKSRHLDDIRGFGKYIHLSSERHSPILRAKLKAGFPHICLRIPTSVLNEEAFDVCRYNVAMSRRLRRDGKAGFHESPQNGFYYDEKQLPIARTVQEKASLIEFQNGKMFEVLHTPPITLPEDTSVIVFSSDDRTAVQEILGQCNIEWETTLSNNLAYTANPDYSVACNAFVDKCLIETSWRGNGLEFDKV